MPASSVFIDQLARTVNINFPPKRIVSIVPSQTELLFELGLDAEIVGITKFCNHPSAKVKNKVRVGGTKQLNIELIRSLNPDLIIGNKEENDRAQIEALMAEFPVWISDIDDLPGALRMINSIGAIVNRADEARLIANAISERFSDLLKLKAQTLRVAYFIWQKPYMVTAKQTFIDDMLQRCGFINVFEQQRYPQISESDLQVANPDVIMLSSEPYPFKDKHIARYKAIVPNARVILVDGEMFSWYGSRLLKSTAYFKQLIDSLV